MNLNKEKNQRQIAEKWLNNAVAHFGTTEDPYEAGYLLPDARMLDFSEKSMGGTAGSRSADHREISRAIPEIWENATNSTTADMELFLISTGSVRMGLWKGASIQLDMYQMPNNLQIGKINRIIRSSRMDIDLDLQKGPYELRTDKQYFISQAGTVGDSFQSWQTSQLWSTIRDWYRWLK